MKMIVYILVFFLAGSCIEGVSEPKKTAKLQKSGVVLKILGTVQDAGSPHIACKKDCCKSLFKTPDINRKVVSLGLIDYKSEKTYLFEATPDITEQLKNLTQEASWLTNELPDGVFLTHAHIGHYTGLMYFGKEATNTGGVRTYTMPKIKGFLERNGPWSQLVSEGNIALHPLKNRKEVQLSANLKVIPFIVPHRDEYSETVGYTIIGPNKRVLFIPDIDKWERWNTEIINEVAKVDYAFVDATFFDGEELNTRDISQIPHPFVIESMELFQNLPSTEKQKIHFIHFNHTNPLLNAKSKQSKKVLKNGFKIAQIHQRFQL